jgi:hypothetical protein
MKQRGSVVVQVAALVLLLAIVILLAWPEIRPVSPPKFETQYQAVLLSGGMVYYGRLEGFGTPYPVLRDVFYVQSHANPETKQVSNILVQRGKEWHAPDRMYLNPGHIVLVEPVSPDSQVAKLIADQKKQP